MRLSLDPPVHPFSDAGAIRRWIERLEELRSEHHDDPAVLALIKERLRDAESWLEFRGYGPAARDLDEE